MYRQWPVKDCDSLTEDRMMYKAQMHRSVLRTTNIIIIYWANKYAVKAWELYYCSTHMDSFHFISFLAVSQKWL